MKIEVLYRLIVGIPLILLALWQVHATRKYVQKLKGPAGATASPFLLAALSGSYLGALIIIFLAVIIMAGSVG